MTPEIQPENPPEITTEPCSFFVSDNHLRSCSWNSSIFTRALLWNSHTQPMLIIEVWMNDETSLGWTRYTPRIYLSFVCYVIVETMLYFVLKSCMTI
ncbi:hypothetical protein Hdeb2414_s0018g00529691 [Helianthus debilis subsp. tardiflorus]